MSFPPMISMITNALYNIVDIIFVARLIEASLTAVTIAFPVQMLMIAVLVGTGVGLSSLISRRLGEGNQREADIATTHGIVLGLFSYVVFAILGIFLSPMYVGFFTDDPVIAGQAILYLRIVMVGSFTISLSVPIERILQATGNMLAPMSFNMAGAIINACLAPIFILGLFGAPQLGVLGAGLVAVFGQGIALIIAITVFHRGTHLVHIDFKGFKLRAKTVKDIYAVALPTMIMMSITSVMISLMNMILIAYSTSAVAVLGAYFRIQQFIFMPVFGMCQGALPLMGFNFGARRKDRLMSIYKIAIIAGIAIMAFGTIIFQLFPHWILSLFAAEGEMMNIGVPAMRVISLGFIPAGFSIVTVSLFQALSHGTAAMFSSILRQLICIIPLAYIFGKIMGLGAIWYAFPIAEIVAFAFSAFYFARVYQKQIMPLSS
jgi:putative MATE family efflux protein